jgi:acid phosphatase family membrane protein YuiD
MFRELLYDQIYLVPITCGIFIQIIKLVLYLAAEKRVNIGALTQIDGMPNLHSAVFSSLAASIGIKYGFSSILFSLVGGYSVIIIHDTMRLKGEKGKQTSVLNRIISSSESYRDIAPDGDLRALRFEPLDVLCGTALGIIGAFMLLRW